MPTITKVQFDRWNGQLTNGFQLDLKRFVIHGDKEARKTFDLSDGRVLEARLNYYPVYENYRVVGYQPTLDLQLWYPGHTEGMMISHGLGVQHKVGQMQQKKQYTVLCKLSGVVTDEQIKQIAAAEMNQLNNGRIM